MTATACDFFTALFPEWPGGVLAEVRAFENGRAHQEWVASATALVALARKRALAPPTEEATLRLLDAVCAVRRWRRAVEVEVLPWR